MTPWRGRGSAGPHPFAVAPSERLVLPDGHLRLDVVDEPAAGRERLLPVGGRGGDHDRRVAHREVADAVQGRDPVEGALPGVGHDLLHDLAHPLLGRGVGGVGQRGHPAAAVVVADGPDEERGASRPGVRDGREDLVDRERGVAALRASDGFHAPDSTTRPRGRAGTPRGCGRRRRTGAAEPQLLRRLRRWWAATAVPIAATAAPAAPAAVMVTSLRPRLRPTRAGVPERWSSSARSAPTLSWAGRHPASRSVAQSTTHG